MRAVENRPYIVYSSESRLRQPAQVVAQMWRGLLAGRYLGYRLFLKDLRADYSHSRFGQIWDLLEPLMLALIFVALMRMRIVNPGEIKIPFSLFVIFGTLIWQTFSESILLPMEIIRRSKPLIMQASVAPEALLLSTFYRMLFNSSFRIVIMVGMAVAMGVWSPLGMLGFLALFPLVVVAGMAFGVALAPFHTVYNDVGRTTRILLRPLMYASPVMYGMDQLKALAAGEGWRGLKTFFVWFAEHNPISVMLVFMRDLATVGAVENAGAFVVTLGLLFALLLMAWFVFNMSVTILAERA